jgi:alkylation response protein AidB-like acyl-CoA dehydrogenase
MSDLESAEEELRLEFRAWIAANFPPALRGQANPLAVETREPVLTPDQQAWLRAVAAKGWGAPTWPTGYGGAGLPERQGEMFATDEQKLRHLAPTARGEVIWCQGFSEPGAGSDLASLQTFAEDCGDHFRVNGQKIWTSGAHHADWCFCLVRTDRTKKHEGISFLLIDMKTAGVEPRPIKLINGASAFCEVFFTDVVVPKENLVGTVNGGWRIAKRLLQHERFSSRRGGLHFESVSLNALAKQYIGLDETGRLADRDLRGRIIRAEMDAQIYLQTADRMTQDYVANQGPNASASILKNVVTWARQDWAELVIEIMGRQGLGWDGDGFNEEELEAVREWLGAKAMTIYGGSQEIQNNIIAKRFLGLPELTQHR